MTGSVFFLHLAGAVALLLWATRMVRTGVERAYGDVLRLKLRATMQNPFLAVITGATLAIALQSSTAVTLLVGSFAGSGIVSGMAGQLAVRGAEIGSSLIVRLLTFDLSLLVPICIAFGTFTFLATERRTWRQVGRISVGIGLMLLSLQMIGQASEPLRESKLVPVIISYFSSDPITAFLMAALITWLFHSSIAAILLLVTLAARGIVPPELGIVMMLGVNLGSSMIAPMLTRQSPPAVRVVPIGNLLMRGAGSIIILALYLAFLPDTSFLGSTPGDQIVYAHILFNCIILIIGVPLAGVVYRISVFLVELATTPEPVLPLAMTRSTVLQEDALDTPSQALANATRAVVGVCESIDLMLRRIFDLYETADQQMIDDLARMDDTVDASHAEIKLYLARIPEARMNGAERMRCQELLGACVKLEQVGDIIVRNMLVHVRKKLANRLEFTDDGLLELANFHAAVLANARMAFNVLVSRDVETARQMVLEKDRLRELEKKMSSQHFTRLREGTMKSVQTSAIHLDTIRDLKQINSLLTSMAYPVLEERGLLQGSRLADGLPD